MVLAFTILSLLNRTPFIMFANFFFFLISKRGEHHHSHLYPNQVRNSTKELKLSTLYNLAQDHKVNKNEDFILKVEGVSFSKAALFFSFHSVQNKQRGAANQTLFRFFPTLALCQARRDWRTVKGNTQL